MLVNPRRRNLARFLIAALACSTSAMAIAEPPSADKDKEKDKDKAKTESNTPGHKLDVSKPYGYHLNPILEKIQANSDQRTKITTVVMSYRSKIDPLRQEYKQKNQDFLNSIFGGMPAEQIMAKQQELSRLSSDISSRYTMLRLEIRRILNPKQVILYEEYCRAQGWMR